MHWDDRAQSIQIGAVLLFGALIIAMSSYQAFVVPQQNEQVEFSHSQSVQTQLQDLRNAFVSVPGDSTPRSVAVQLGTRYPERLIALNPGPPSGSLRTGMTGDSTVALGVDNGTAPGETGDVWNGTERTYQTGWLTYSPNYNLYGGAPTTYYEHSVLYNEFGAQTVPLSGQTLVDGDRISLVALNGTFGTTRTGSATVDVRPVSASTTTVTVRNESASENVTVRVPTRLTESAWEALLAEETVDEGGHVYDVRTAPLPGIPDARTLVVELEAGVAYDLQLAKAGVGTSVTGTSEAYLTDVSGNGSTVPEESTQVLVVEVRDAYNNPVSGVEVTGQTDSGSLASTTATTDGAGRATFRYEAPAVTERTDVPVNVSYAVDPAAVASFDGSEPENAVLTVEVQNTQVSGASEGGGPAPYALDWRSPATTEGGTYLDPCDSSNCTWDVGADENDELDLTAGTTPDVEGATVDFALNNSTLGTLDPSDQLTGANGRASTTVTARANGTLRLYAVSGGASDVLNLTVVNVTLGAPTADFTYSPSSPTAGDEVQFTDQSTDSDGTIASWAWDLDGDGTVDSTVQDPAYTYSSSGTYDVELTVTDDDGNSDVVTKTVTVDEADTTPPTFDSAAARAESTDGDGKDAEQVAFSADVSDDTGVDRVETRVYDKNGNLVGSKTFSNPPFSDEPVLLDPDASMNGGGNFVDVELTAYDTSGNARTCSGRIDDVSQEITKGNGLSCDQTSTAGLLAALSPGLDGPGGPGGAVAALGLVFLSLVAAGTKWQVAPLGPARRVLG